MNYELSSRTNLNLRSQRRTRSRLPRAPGWVAFAASIALLVPLFFAWALLAPTTLGGSVSYVITFGSSMEPKLHRGDLVIVRQAEHYQIGEVVAYHSPDIGKVVLHRIVGRDGDRYVFKGDNNNWLDSYHPRQAELVGRQWFHVPSGGTVMERFRSPRNAALATGLLALLTGGVTSSGVATQKNKRPKRERQGGLIQGAGPRPPTTAMLLGFGLCAFAILPIAVTAFHRPTTRHTWTETDYTQTGTFDYHAHAPPSEVYDDGLVENGDPVFLNLVPAVTMDFAYEFSSEGDHAVAGSGQLIAQLSDVNGWNRTLELQPRTPFAGDRFTATGTIDLAQVKQLGDDVQALTGIARDHYTLTVSAVVQVSGTIDGQELEDTFAHPLVFTFDPLQLRLGAPNGIDPATSVDPFTASTIGTVQLPHSEPNVLSAMGLQMNVYTVRLMSVIIGLLCLAGLLGIGLLMLLPLGHDEPSNILARYGARMIPVSGVAAGVRGAVVEVASMDKLAQFAEYYDRVILHEELDGVHSYLVQDGEVTYRYRPRSDDASPNLQRHAPPPSLEDLRPLSPEELPKLRILHREVPERARDTRRPQAG
jgi:signal peptidase